MVNVCDRWNRDKTDNLQYAFFNGVGYESWENMWGIWNQITPRDVEALRRIAKIERALASLLISPGWEPHTPILRHGVFASKFPGPAQTLWTLVNRNEYDIAGRQIALAYNSGMHFYDVWHGEELKPDVSGSTTTLSFELEVHGFGAALATEGAPASSATQKLLAEVHELARTRLATLSHEWKVLPQQLVEIASTQRAHAAPAGMVRIPEADFQFHTAGIMIEGGNDVGVDVQYPWGNEWDPAAVPAPDQRREMRAPTNVDAYPKGASPFGVMDLVGNVWQCMDEFMDEHTRAAILKGGSFYQPQGSL
jgi:hypothetical protein